MTKVRFLMFLTALFIIPRICADELPDWFTPLRDAIYSQSHTSREIGVLYTAARERAGRELSGTALSIMLSRCEYMMGRSHYDEQNQRDARTCFEKGMDYAEKALDVESSAEGWQMLADNLSYLCDVRSTGFLMTHGLKIERYAKRALAIDPGNTAAQFLIASQYVYAPAPFHNYKKGLQMMEAIYANYENRLYRDDRYNVYLAIGNAHYQLNRKDEAKIWFVKALELYPENKRAKKLIAELM